MNLDDLGLQIGSPIQLQMVDDESKRFTVQLIGFVKHQGLILSANKTGDTDLAMVLRDSQPLIIRFKTATTAVAFRTHIIGKHLVPYPHIHVAIPDEIESRSVTKQDMVSVHLPLTFINEDKESRPAGATMTGLSVEQVSVKSSTELATEGDTVSMTMTFTFAGEQHVIVIEGKVESCSMLDGGEQQIVVRLAGLDQSDQILLQGLYYKQLLIKMKLIES